MRIFRLISDQLALLTLAAAVIAYLQPSAFLIFSDSFLWLFAATMFALGIVLELDELRCTLSRPRAIVLGVATQYSVMPVLGFVAASLGALPPELALGFVIVGAAPGAMASNVIVYLAGGALAYSIALTTVATLLAPVLTPALVKWLGGAFLPVEFWPLMVTIMQTVVLPLALGMWVQRFLGKALYTVRAIAPAIAALAIVIICAYAVAVNQTQIANMGFKVFILVVALNALGYIMGWYLGKLYAFDAHDRLTLAVEIGMQNAGLGVALALKHFSALTALPGTIFAVWCILTGAGFCAYARHKNKSVKVV